MGSGPRKKLGAGVQAQPQAKGKENIMEKEIEKEILDKGLIAPRVTPERIDSVIAEKSFHRLTGTLTVCVLTLKNGFTVTGESACASPENFNEEIGNKIAFSNAREKIWALEGYLLKQRLYDDLDSGEAKIA